MAKPRTAGVSLKPWLRHALPTLALLAAWRWSQAPDDPLSGPLVRVEQGVLLGAHRLTHYDAIPYFSFQGIPYAKPPLGELRFKAPLPPDSWSDVRPALEEGHMCCQPHTEIYWMPPEVNKLTMPSARRAWNIASSLPRLWGQIRRFWAQQEDCLFLNVYTKQIRAEAADAEDDDDIATAKLSPVVVFIHGGGFYTGTANSHIYGPDFLLREDVVLVTVQYRLGALGFLAPGSQDAPGNAGLRDQAMALKWVRRNIRRFGGDPASVTLLGHSAGAASVHYHTMSPGSRGLFHRAVQLSGTALNSWAYASPAESSHRARRLASLLGCGGRCATPDGLVAFLRTKAPRELIDASYNVFDNLETAAGQISPFVPTLDDATSGTTNDTTAFLRSSPEEVMAGRSPHYWPVPTLVGQNDAEGMIVLLPDIITQEMAPSAHNAALLEEDFERVVPTELGLARGSVESRLVADMMRKHYLQGEAISGRETETFVKIYGDLMFSIGLGRYMRALHRISPQPTFFYFFSFDGRLSVVKKLVRGELPGVSHGDELGYLFPVEMMPAEDIRPGDVDLLVRDRWTRMVANFAKFGSPTAAPTEAVVDAVLNVSWPTSTPSRPRHVDIGASMQLRDGYPLEAAFRFWDGVFRAIGRQSVSD